MNHYNCSTRSSHNAQGSLNVDCIINDCSHWYVSIPYTLVVESRNDIKSEANAGFLSTFAQSPSFARGHHRHTSPRLTSTQRVPWTSAFTPQRTLLCSAEHRIVHLGYSGPGETHFLGFSLCFDRLLFWAEAQKDTCIEVKTVQLLLPGARDGTIMCEGDAVAKTGIFPVLVIPHCPSLSPRPT